MSDSDARARREFPERVGPNRNPLMPPQKLNGAAPHNGAHPFSRPEQPCGDPLKDALECGVRIAYTVIDDYVRRGYEAARNCRVNQTQEGKMFDNRNYYSGGTNPWGWVSSPMLPWMSAMRAWSEMLCAFTPGCWPQPQQPMGNPGCYPGGSAPVLPVSLKVETTHAVEAKAEVYPGAECLNLKCGALEDKHGHKIDDVSVSSQQGVVQVTVRIKPNQEQGSYCGWITDSNGRTVGSVNVDVKP